MNFLSLFSGIGGFDLGLERAGMRCVGQVEIDPFCRRVLAKHWPDVPRFEDVKTFDPKQINERIDLIAGGFPCQDISVAGSRTGIEGERSSLWYQMLRIIRSVRPRYAIVENVAALLDRGMGTVLSGLAECGFDAEWSIVPACALGSPHTRERVFIIAYPHEIGRREAREHSDRCDELSERFDNWQAAPDSASWRDVQRWLSTTFQNGDWESPETAIHRMDDGIPAWVDRNGYLGNAVVPQVAELIGRAILAAHAHAESERAA